MPDAPGADAVEEELLGVEEEEESQFETVFTGAHGPGTRLAGRIGRHAAAYGAAAAATMLAGLVSVVVFTRFLDQSEFGKMAVLSTISTIITTLATLGIMQGTMRRVYGHSVDDEAGEVDAIDHEAIAADPRLALSTGLALSVLFGAALFLLAVGLQREVSGLFGGSQDRTLIILAAGAGAAGGVMRFSRNILRLQLRSGAYLVVTLIYAFGGIAVAIPLLENGSGIEGVLIGFIVANFLSAAICVLLMISDLRPAVSLREARAILGGGLVYLPLVLSFQAVQMGDTLLVATCGGFSQTGLYRVAQRIAMPISFGTSVFQQSWGPLKRDMTQVAVDRIDEERLYAARLFTYYAVFVTALILSVAVLADQLVRLASGEFGEAAAIVPLTTLSVAGHGWFIFSYRNAHLPKKMLWMVGLTVFAGLAFVGLSVMLIPALGAIGAPIAAIAAWGFVTLVMLGANQLVGEAIPYEYRNLLVLGGLTLCVWSVSKWVLPDTTAGTVVKLALLLAWAGCLLAARIVPMSDLHAVGRFLRDASGIDSRRHLRSRLAGLEDKDAVLVHDLVRRKRPPSEVAERTGLSEEEVMASTVRVLRRVAGGGAPKDTDAELGTLLLLPMSRPERDLAVMTMVTNGADPLDADLVKRAASVAASQRAGRLGAR